MRTSQTDVTNLMQLIKTFEDNAIPSLERFRGHVVKKLGDGILAVFVAGATGWRPDRQSQIHTQHQAMR